MRKIGFVNSLPEKEENENENENENDNDPFGFSFNEEMATRYIDENYAPDGDVDQKEFRTTLELITEMSEMVDVVMRTVNKILHGKGFKTIFIDGVSNWVLYEKIKNS